MSYFRNMNEYKDAVKSEIALKLFTIRKVCLIKSVDINLFYIGKSETGQSW